MSLFHVFIERPRSTAPGAVAALARAIAERYGIPAADLEGRLAAGRFRVKGNVDRATADTYAHDLARLGAVCMIVSAEAPPEASAPAVTLPKVERIAAPSAAAPITAGSVARQAAPSAGVATTLASPTRPVTPAPPPRSTPSASWPPADVEIPQELGALSGEFPLTLSTLDGATEDEARASRKVKLPASFAPPEAESAASASRKVPVPLPASFGPAPEAEPDDGDIDMNDSGALDVFDPFAPPEAQANAPELTLAVDRAPRKSKTVSEAPPPAAAPPPPSDAGHATSASHALPATLATHAAEPAPAPRPAAPSTGGGWKGLLRDDATRLVAGAVLAVLIGAVPALLIGSSRERAAFAELDGELEKRQSEIRTLDAWDDLDRLRATFTDRKHAERQSIVITSLMIWAVIGGGFTWLWFRKIDWDRVLA